MKRVLLISRMAVPVLYYMAYARNRRSGRLRPRDWTESREHNPSLIQVICHGDFVWQLGTDE